MLCAKMAQWSVSDWADVIEAVFVVFGGAFALCRWRRNSKVRKSEYLNSLMDKLRSDDDMKETLKEFEYNASWYTSDFHKGECGLEQKVDKLLQYYTYICYLQNNGLLNDKEFLLFKYEIKHTLFNYGVQDYLYNIYHFSKRMNTDEDKDGVNKSFSFYYLIKFGVKENIIDKDFLEGKAHLKPQKYHHYLNF